MGDREKQINRRIVFRVETSTEHIHIEANNKRKTAMGLVVIFHQL